VKRFTRPFTRLFLSCVNGKSGVSKPRPLSECISSGGAKSRVRQRLLRGLLRGISLGECSNPSSSPSLPLPHDFSSRNSLSRQFGLELPSLSAMKVPPGRQATLIGLAAGFFLTSSLASKAKDPSPWVTHETRMLALATPKKELQVPPTIYQSGRTTANHANPHVLPGYASRRTFARPEDQPVASIVGTMNGVLNERFLKFAHHHRQIFRPGESGLQGSKESFLPLGIFRFSPAVVRVEAREL
jgi:hypothetical protein